jgi:hypothetical protein
MLSIGNKTFDEIKVGDIASTQRTLQAGDVRAWASAFGNVELLASPTMAPVPLALSACC